MINDNYFVDCVAGKTVCVHVTCKESYPVNCVTSKKDGVYVTRKRDSLVTDMARKDCLFVTGKKDIVNVFPVNFCPVVTCVHFANRFLQMKGVNLDCGHRQEKKYVNNVSCVDHLSSVKHVTYTPTVFPDLPVGARLHQFWGKWADLGISPKVITVLKEGYTLPFRFCPNLTRSLTIISCYVNPHRNLYLMEALHQLFNKNAVEPVTTQIVWVLQETFYSHKT